MPQLARIPDGESVDVHGPRWQIVREKPFILLVNLFR